MDELRKEKRRDNNELYKEIEDTNFLRNIFTEVHHIRIFRSVITVILTVCVEGLPWPQYVVTIENFAALVTFEIASPTSLECEERK